MFEKNPRRFNYKPKLCQNAALSLNGMRLNIPSTKWWTLCRAASSSGTACVGNGYARSLATWAILSISDYDYATCPHQTFKAWSMIVVLITVYDIVISSQSSHSSASNWHALNYWLTYKMTDTYSIVTVGPIAMQFRRYQENISNLKFRKFHINPSNFNRKLTMMSKLDLRKLHLPHLDPRCRTG